MPKDDDWDFDNNQEDNQVIDPPKEPVFKVVSGPFSVSR
jgi:hypothetical protein